MVFAFCVGRQKKAVTLNDTDLGARVQATTQGSRQTLPHKTRSYCGHGELPLTGSKSDLDFLLAKSPGVSVGSLYGHYGLDIESLWGHYKLKLALKGCSAWECSNRKAWL